MRNEFAKWEIKTSMFSGRKSRVGNCCSIATGADSKIARQEQGESTWDPLNASELAANSANGLIPSLIAWAKSQRPGNVAIVSEKTGVRCDRGQRTKPSQRKSMPGDRHGPRTETV